MPESWVMMDNSRVVQDDDAACDGEHVPPASTDHETEILPSSAGSGSRSSSPVPPSQMASPGAEPEAEAEAAATDAAPAAGNSNAEAEAAAAAAGAAAATAAAADAMPAKGDMHPMLHCPDKQEEVRLTAAPMRLLVGLFGQHMQHMKQEVRSTVPSMWLVAGFFGILAATGGLITGNSISGPFAQKDVLQMSPAGSMTRHSAALLDRVLSETNASGSRVLTFREGLQLKQMQVDLDTQVFTASRKSVKAIMKRLCNLPKKLCEGMMAAANTKQMKYHTKISSPIDSNQGSYSAVWMWARQQGSGDLVEVAYKGASLSYQLRDVVTYREQVVEEPVIECETMTSSYFTYLQWTEERCREVSKKRTSTPLPVFKQSVMTPEEMDQVDVLMESLLAERVIDGIEGVTG